MIQPKSWKDLVTPLHRIAVVSELKDISSEAGGTSIVFRASTPVKDRDGERIHPMGWVWRETLPNQLYNHDPKVAANWIGKGKRAWKDEEAFFYETTLFDKSPSPTADLARQIAWIAHNHPECLTSSVGFSPLKWRDPNGQEFTIDNPKGSAPWAVPGREYLEQECLENSVAPVASNFEALAVQVRSLGGLFAAESEPETALPIGDALEKALLDGTLTAFDLIEKAALHGVVLEQLDSELYGIGIRKSVSRPSVKVGAVLSRANLDRLNSIATLANEVIASATPAGDSTEK